MTIIIRKLYLVIILSLMALTASSVYGAGASIIAPILPLLLDESEETVNPEPGFQNFSMPTEGVDFIVPAGVTTIFVIAS